MPEGDFPLPRAFGSCGLRGLFGPSKTCATGTRDPPRAGHLPFIRHSRPTNRDFA